MEYGITEKGFIAKPYAAILQEEREAWKTAFGYEIDPSPDTPEGAYIGVQAIKLTQLWEMAEGLYAAGDPDTASGVYLDRLVSLVNVERIQAIPTRVYAAIWEKEGKVINRGHIAKMSLAEEKFVLQENVKIDRNKLLGFQFKVEELETELYTLSIDGKVVSYIATENDTKESVQNEIVNQIEGLFPNVFKTVNLGDNGIEIHSKAGIIPFVLFCDDPKIKITLLGALGVYLAVKPGALYVGIGALDTLVTNTGDHIINYAAGITGREAESDAELRVEKNNRQKQASGNEVSIENEVKKVSGVLFCKVYSNRSMDVVDGHPPKSYETIVIGGEDQEIAEAIFRKGPGGIQAFGNTIVTVKDAENFPWEVGFSRPENKYIWINVVIEKYVEEDFPAKGIELIKNNVEAWGVANLEVGVDLIYQRLNKPIFAVPGIGFAEITVAMTDDLTPPNANDYTASNLEVGKRQIAIIDRTRITVTEKT
ncbi:MAG: hypothetical protein LBU82_04940 [Treponema sp.]|jgi:uncharacterized phage protein gp47/JayE|nr:hypothetical protein [Treponema sp.]